MLDPTFAMYVEKDGVPLSAFEFRQEWFYHDGKDLVFVLDKDRKRYQQVRHSGLPQPLRRLRRPRARRGRDSTCTRFIGYVPNTNLMNAGPDYGGMFITQDKLCDGTKWHKRTVPADPRTTPTSRSARPP